MTHQKNDELRAEAVRTVLFVLVLLSVAEVAAPYFRITFSDPLLLTAFVTGAIGMIIGRPRGSFEHKHQFILVIKDSSFQEVCTRLSCEPEDIAGVTIAGTTEQALESIKTGGPHKASLAKRLIDYIKR